MSPSPFPALAILALLPGAMPAAEVFRDDMDTAAAWKPMMSWLSNPTAVAETTTPEAGVVRLRVPERRRGMKWVREAAFAITPAAHTLSLRYRAEHIQPDPDFAVNVSAPQADTQPIQLAQLVADGAWHTISAAIPLDAGAAQRACSGLVLQVQSDDAGNGVLEVDWIAVGDADTGPKAVR